MEASSLVWRKQLSVVDIIDGGDDIILSGDMLSTSTNDAQEIRFYSNLYRASLFPRMLHEYDVNGKAVHRSPFDPAAGIYPGNLVTDQGFWDSYRTVGLPSLLFQEQYPNIIDGWVQAFNEGGWLPKWASPGYRSGMVGTMGDATLADAIVKEISGFNTTMAYAAILKDATVNAPNDENGRQGLDQYIAHGYMPSDVGVSEDVSRSLNDNLSDYCISQAASKLGHTDDATLLLQRSKGFTALFDSTSGGFFRPKRSNGQFETPFDPLWWGGHYTEASAWQYRFYAPHDVETLASLYGGKSSLCEKLDSMFSRPPAFHIGSYGSEIHEQTEMAVGKLGLLEMGNQPAHHVPSIFAPAGCPEKGHFWTRKVLRIAYFADGSYSGDEDNGEMASWFLLQSLGLFQRVPARPYYQVGSPVFRHVKVTIGNSILEIIAENNSKENVYVQTVTWRGVPLNGPEREIAYFDLIKGGELKFTMTASPNGN